MHLIGMHGWCGDSRRWEPWRQHSQGLGWHWQSGERGYGTLTPATPHWPASSERRALIVHSLGLHLVPQAVLEEADAVVLLASFGRFVPEGAAGRRLSAALAAMAAQLAGPQASAMLQAFQAKVAAPSSPDQLPPAPAAEPLTEQGLERLREDLLLLEQTRGLPVGFPATAAVLIVEAGLDQIVVEAARQELRAALPQAECWHLAGAGHALLEVPLVPDVCDWIRQHLDG